MEVEKSKGNIEIGKRIGYYRRQYHLTQEELAEMINVSPKHVSSVERGLSNYSIDNLIALTKIFHCSLDYLVNGDHENEVTLLNQLPCEVVQVLVTGSPREREILDGFMSLFVKTIETER